MDSLPAEPQGKPLKVPANVLIGDVVKIQTTQSLLCERQAWRDRRHASQLSEVALNTEKGAFDGQRGRCSLLPSRWESLLGAVALSQSPSNRSFQDRRLWGLPWGSSG